MKNKTCLSVLIALVCLLTACPAPEFSHVIVNDSKTFLDVEYEYFAERLREDHSQIASPVKVSFEQYANGGQTEWNALTTENEYVVETLGEESVTLPYTDQPKKSAVRRVKLRLLPGEVLRVFVSGHINSDLKNLKRIKLNGENGKFEIEGAGFEQFSDYRPDRFFTDTKDYRIVYR